MMMNVPSCPESFALSPYATVGDHEDNGMLRDHHLAFLDTTFAAAGSGDIFQLYPGTTAPMQYLAGSYGGASTLSLPYYPAQPALQLSDYYFGAGKVGSSALDNTSVSIPATHLGLNLGYRSYFPARGGYVFRHGKPPPRCQAEGCKADLSRAKPYHLRHKVCERHSKESVVFVSGSLPQRFCQQCSRFHSLDEFDDVKKSCRKRLADHNRRRRRTKAGSAITANNIDKKKHGNKASINKDSKSKGAATAAGSNKEHQQLAAVDRSSAVIKKPSPSLGGPAKEADKLPFLPAILEGKAATTLHEHQLNSVPSLIPPSPGLWSGSHQSNHLGFLNSGGNDMSLLQLAEQGEAVSIAGFGQLQPGPPASNLLQLGQAIFELDFI